MSSKTTTRKRTTTVKALPGKQNGGVGKGGVVTVHGITTTGYQRGCRCDLCVAAASEYARKARERKRAQAEVKTAKPARAKRTTVKPTTTRTRRSTKPKTS
jgi:hypothetical protein